MNKILCASVWVALLFAAVTRTNANACQTNQASRLFTCMRSQPQPPSAESMAQRETEWMTKELSLSEDQVKKVNAINLKYAEKQAEMFQGGPGGDFEAMQKKMKEINDQKRAEFEGVLTAEQLKKYDDYVAQNQRGPGGPGRPGGGAPPF